MALEDDPNNADASPLTCRLFDTGRGIDVDTVAGGGAPNASAEEPPKSAEAS